MKLVAFFFLIALFVVLTPGVFLTLPKKSVSKWVIALTHGVIFAIVWFIIHKPITQLHLNLEGNTSGPAVVVPPTEKDKKKA